MNLKKVFILILLDAIVIGILFVPIRLPESPVGEFDEHRLCVEYQQTTETSLYFVEKDSEKIKRLGYSISIYALGDKPNNWIWIEELVNHRYILYGDFRTERNGEGDSIFYIKKWAPTDYIPIVFCVKGLVYLLIFCAGVLPVLIILLLYLLVKRKAQQ